MVKPERQQSDERETGGKFLFTNDVAQAASGILEHLDRKRLALKLAPMMYAGDRLVGDVAGSRPAEIYQTPKGLVALGCGETQRHSQSRPPTD